MLEDIGFSFEQMLEVVSDAEDELVTPFAFTVPELVRRFHLHRKTARRVCDRLEQRGLVRKTLITMRDDWGNLSSRKPGYVLTDEGRELLAKQQVKE
jgi:DNA-binding MarR family transcriptional regulator